MAHVAPPPISGSCGSRIRIVLGKTGSEYLLLCDEDDGDRQWQSQHCNGISKAVAKQLNNCSAKGRHVTHFDFGPTGAWSINGQKRDGSGRYSWWGFPGTAVTSLASDSKMDVMKFSFGSDGYNNETFVIVVGPNRYSCNDFISEHLKSRMKRIHDRQKTIQFVRLFHDGGYYISDSEGSEWVGLGIHLEKELKNRRGGTVKDVAVAEDGTWVVIRDHKFVSSVGVAEEVKNKLAMFYNNQKTRNRNREVQIQQHHERIRLAEEAEAEQQAAAERARIEQERIAQAAREAAEQERAEREASRAEAAKEKAQQEALELAHVQELIQEDERIQVLEESLNKLKCLFRASYESLRHRSDPT